MTTANNGKGKLHNKPCKVCHRVLYDNVAHCHNVNCDWCESCTLRKRRECGMK